MASGRVDQAEFIKGLDLCEQFYFDVVKPLLLAQFAAAPFSYTAALIGNGSEMLSFDTAMSTDHDWGPRCMLFLSPQDTERYGDKINQVLRRCLPPSYLGYPTGFVPSTEQEGNASVQVPCHSDSSDAEINHKIVITTVKSFVLTHLGYDIHTPLTAFDWLTFPEQKLLTLTAGRVFERYDCASDSIVAEAELDIIRQQFSYYPNDIRLYIIASYWRRIESEGHLMCRCGTVGDEIGSAIIAGRLVRDIMHLCFLYQHVYAPYPKWYGSAFNNLAIVQYHGMTGMIEEVLAARDWKTRHDSINRVYELLCKIHNECDSLGVCRLPVHSVQFHSRPFKVMSLGNFSEDICKCINDPSLEYLLKRGKGFGGIDTFCDNCNLLEDVTSRKALLTLYLTTEQPVKETN